jgi:glucosamine-6-phosphate deaminase
LNIQVHASKELMGRAAAGEASRLIRNALDQRGEAVIILATGTSQFETLGALTLSPGIAWDRVILFHLDEYIGLTPEHPASFRRYLSERFVSPVGRLRRINFIRGEAEDPHGECRRIGRVLAGCTVDVALVGIGENGHLAFNDPPADFETREPFIVVELDEVCRRQQLGEGWFASLEEVPTRAVSMSVREIMRSRSIVASIPEARKAEAVRKALEGEVTPDCPASILQRHPDCGIFLDAEAASRLSEGVGGER